MELKCIIQLYGLSGKQTHFFPRTDTKSNEESASTVMVRHFDFAVSVLCVCVILKNSDKSFIGKKYLIYGDQLSSVVEVYHNLRFSPCPLTLH